MSALFTVAIPEFEPRDREFIESFRARHHPKHHSVISAHFTLVFRCSPISESEYHSHVASVAQSLSPISFSCRYAMLGADDEDETAYVFLVPDEGYSGISRLHDALYTGPLEPFHRLDLPYIPHITIGASASRPEAKRLCDSLNAQGLSLHGTVSHLHVGSVQDGKFIVSGSFPLQT
jgi:2'-5' RNA ligase